MTTPRRPARAALALLAVASLSGCTAAVDRTPAAAPPVVEVLSSADIVPYTDGLTHLVVTTFTGAGAPAPTADPDVAPTSAAASSSGTWRRVVDRPPTGLEAVTATTPAELDALAIAGEGSAIVEDTEGLVGEPGARYLRTLGSLFAVEPEAGTAPGPAVAIADAADRTDGLAAAIAQFDGVVAAEVVGPGIVAVSADPAAASSVSDRIDALDGVADVDEDVLFGLTDDPRQGQQWAITNTGDRAQADGHAGTAGVDVRAPLAWSVTEGAGTVVAVIDSGVDLAHPDLAANIWTNPAEQCGNGADDDGNGLVDDCNGWDFGDRDADPSPVQGATGWYHGTHVAGIVAAARNGTGTVGVAPAARILPLKVSDSAGRISLAAIAAAIDYAAAHADVINLSLGTSPGTPREYVTGLEAAVARAGAAGVTVVAAMGNDGVDISNRPVWPASYASFYDHVIAVGASTNTDARASFSNTGAPLTIYAPGWAVMSTMPQGAWGFLYGTSMATPVVAGAAAAVRAAGTATAPGAIRARLVATAVSAGAGRRLDLAAAVGYVPPTERPAVSVTLVGADRVVADTPSTLEWAVATRDTTTAVAARLSVAVRDASGVGAVSGLDADLATALAGPRATITDDRGEFPIVPLDGAALAAGGASLTATVSLPPAEYAFVVELLDAAGQPVAPPVATFLSIAAPGGVVPGTVPAGSPETVPATTTVTTVPGATPAPVTTVPATTSPATTVATPATTRTGGGVGTPPNPTTTTATATTIPDRTQVTTSTVAPATTSVATTLAPTPNDPVTTASPTTLPTSGPTTIPASPTTTPVSPTTPPGPGTPGVTTTTLPAPQPVRDGDYRATAISPRSGPTTGGTAVTIDGVFPASVPVYVWFGDSWSTAVRSATDTTSGTTTRLTATTPAAVAPGVRDVVIRFATDRSVELRLTDAFEYVATTPGTPGTPSPTTTAPAPTPNPTPTPTPTPTTLPATTVAPTTPAPPATTTVTTVAPPRTLGRFTLRPVAAGSALSTLPASAWPTAACRTSTCPGTVL